jgi:hypothetical protein
MLPKRTITDAGQIITDGMHPGKLFGLENFAREIIST